MEITKEQVLELKKLGNCGTSDKLKEWFPEAFNIQLEIGKWYFHDKSNAIVNYQGGSSGYGFSSLNNLRDLVNDRWSFETHAQEWRLATTEEWESALIEEAKRRGLYDAQYFKHANILKVNNGEPGFIEDIQEDKIWTKYGCVYHKGVWAEIVKTFSKEEAEKLLGGKII